MLKTCFGVSLETIDLADYVLFDDRLKKNDELIKLDKGPHLGCYNQNFSEIK